ncbi:VOC family protein [Cellulomonas hominis]
MSVHEQAWPQGTPAWAEMMVPDLQVARDFYGPLFDWDFAVGPPETGYYTTCLRGGRAAAAFAGPMSDEPPAHVFWTTYLAVDDAAATATRAAEAGAQVLFGPMPVMEFGTMAVLTDPTGGTVALWQAGTHTGAAVVNEPGAMIWNELLTRDVPAAQAFYGSVFGYTFQDMSSPEMPYVALELDGRVVGGLGGMPPGTPPDVPPYWSVYFAVADTDAVVAEAVRLGGTSLAEPWDSPFGRQGVLRGPFGETFVVMSTTEPSSPPADA